MFCPTQFQIVRLSQSGEASDLYTEGQFPRHQAHFVSKNNKGIQRTYAIQSLYLSHRGIPSPFYLTGVPYKVGYVKATQDHTRERTLPHYPHFPPHYAIDVHQNLFAASYTLAPFHFTTKSNMSGPYFTWPWSFLRRFPQLLKSSLPA